MIISILETRNIT